MAAWMFPSTIKRRRMLRTFISHSSQLLMSDTGDRLCLKYGTKMPPLGRRRLLLSDMRVFSAELLNLIRTKQTSSLCFKFNASKKKATKSKEYCSAPKIPIFERVFFTLL
jgi:hypothetical protein